MYERTTAWVAASAVSIFVGLLLAGCGPEVRETDLNVIPDSAAQAQANLGELAPGAGLFFHRQNWMSNVHPAADEAPGKPDARYAVSSSGPTVEEMLSALDEGQRARIATPGRFGDITIDVHDQWLEDVADFDGNGKPDRLLLRRAVVPQGEDHASSAAWLVAVLASGKGEFGPDQEKQATLVDAALVPGDWSPITNIEVSEDGVVFYDLYNTDVGQFDRWQAESRKSSEVERLAPDLQRDHALVVSAMRVYDTGVLAPETAYVRAFIRKSYLPEVEAVEPTRDMIFPEILRPLYGSLKLVQARLTDPTTADLYTTRDPLMGTMTTMLVHEGDLRLALSSDELRSRMEGLQALGDQFGAIEEGLTLDGEKVRRRDFETRLTQVSDAGERAQVVKAYQDSFRPIVDEGGAYHQFIDEMNEMARGRGYKNYPDMRMVEKFGVDLDGFQAWLDETWAETDEPAMEFIQSLRKFSRSESLTYWQVGQLTDAWVLDQVGMAELPALSEEDAQAVLHQLYKDVGFDMSKAPYNRITMDWYQDDLKWNRSGTAATATPALAYFTSNLVPGVPIPINEWETAVHETGHTIHYQTSGAASQGLSAYQNNMPSYVAEGVAMTMEDVPYTNEAMMRRYFEGKAGFSDKFFQVYPQAKEQSSAWQTRRLLLMANYELNLYVDKDAEGKDIPWSARVGAWDGMVREKLFVEPPDQALAQIICRGHPFDDQSMLGYGAYALGSVLVGQIRKKTIVEGTDAEFRRYGEAMHELMAQGALATRASTQEIIDNL